jgi:ATP-dependent Clp protease protease subunit
MELHQSLIPTVLEESSRGERAFDIYSLLLRERIVFLGQEVDHQVANLIISQMLYLEAQDPERTSPCTSTHPAARPIRHGHL